MRLTTRQKFSLIFSIYVSLFLALVGAIFFLILHNFLTYQIQKDAATAATDALKNHIAIEKEIITTVKDKTGDSLSNEVIESNVSILLLDNNLKVISGYGLLELYDQGDAESVKTIAKMAEDTQSSSKPYTKIVTWREQSLSTYVAPIKNNGKIYGAIVAAKSLTQAQALEKIILLTLIGIIITSIIISLLLSRLLVKQIFKPIRSLTEIISTTDLDKLDKTLAVSGNKSDDLVILGNKFNEMMTRLKSMSEQQKEFITNASHELKTPLSRAISSFELSLSSNKLNSQTIREIQNDLFEINNLLDKLMFLSKLRPGTILPSDKLSINKLIKESIEVFQKEFNQKKISITIHLDQDVTISIPKEYAKILLRNLLSNAIKYSKENSKISIKTRRLDKYIRLTITDQGSGINKYDLKKIEKRFYRGSAGKRVGGHGIGLSIVRRIVDLYQIRFSIKSEPKKGTQVILDFPIS